MPLRRTRFVLSVVSFCLLTPLSECSCADVPLQVVICDAKEAIRDKNKYIEWRSALHMLTDAELESALQHDDNNVAIGAAWEYYVIHQTEPDHRNEPGITDAGAAAFSAFVAGRLRVIVPEWYTRGIGGGVVRKDNLSFHEYPYEKHMSDLGHGIFAYSKSVARISDETVRLNGRSAYLDVPLTLLQEPGKTYSAGVSFASEGQVFWVALHSPFFGCRLARFDRGLPKWETKLWRDIDPAPSSGVGGDDAETVMRHGGLVYVLGVSTTFTYLEGFDAVTGDVKLRFTSSTGARHHEVIE